MPKIKKISLPKITIKPELPKPQVYFHWNSLQEQKKVEFPRKYDPELKFVGSDDDDPEAA